MLLWLTALPLRNCDKAGRERLTVYLLEVCGYIGSHSRVCVSDVVRYFMRVSKGRPAP